MKNCLQLLFLLFSSCHLFSQNPIGIPDIINFTKEIYNAGTENRKIVEDKNGIIYFANSEGVLSFDGTYWKLHPLPNKTMVRSVAIGSDNRIYAGGQNEMGYFSPDKKGVLAYTSLKTLLSEKNTAFRDVWDIVSYGNDIFFRSQSKIFQLTNNSITVYQANSDWQFLGLSNNQLIAQESKTGLLEFKNGVWSPLEKQVALPPDFAITSLVPFGKESSLITTLNKGLYILSGNKVSRFQFIGQDPFLNERIMSTIPINDDLVAIGTHLGGCYIINKKGEIIQNFSRNEGLQNNTILAVFLDKNRNLWLGLDNGIDFVPYNDAIKHIHPEKVNEGSGFSSIIFHDELYIGTSNWLYKVGVSQATDLTSIKRAFEAVPNIKGRCWSLSIVNGILLLAHHDGAFEIKNGAAFPVNIRTGYWTFTPFYNVLPSSLVVAGNYHGLDFMEFVNNKFISKGNLANFNESSRFITIDNNKTIWIAHIYRGVYKIDMNEMSGIKIKMYADTSGLPSSLNNRIFQIKNRIVVASEEGIHEYDPKTDRFQPSSYFKKFFGKKNIRYLREDPLGNIWFIEEKNLGIIDFSGKQPETIYFPELNGKIVSGFEHIYPYDAYNIFIGAEKGFYHINYDQYKKNNNPVQVNIRSVRAIGKTDSLLFGGYFADVNEILTQPKDAIPQVGYNHKSFHFEYSSPLYEHQSNIDYSYFLNGFDKEWSAWSKKTEKDYTNLPFGSFTFQIKAKNNLGKESLISSYSFTLLPPWYRTRVAYLIYIILLAAIIYVIYFRLKNIFVQQQVKHQEAQKQLQYLHQLELEKSEKALISLKNEKLQTEIEYKNGELASVAMHLVQKGELLGKIKEELMRLKKNSNGEKPSDDFKKLIRILNEEDKMDKDWEQFTIHFDHVHSDFLRAMKETYPNLSAHELKLCAYLRMNLSSKEIAQLMNISVRGVEISRYRLRKKLEIPTETNLFNFLLEFSSAKLK